ncbi:MAG: pilus (MSHA type) biogenesis protein MshL [Sulfurimonas sp.]|nr:pilus (MSHA type) biogenesis protein MshL [Sulfurimonas sp.]
MKTLKSSIYTALLTILLSSHALADCSFELFSISSTKGTKIIDFVEQLSDECEFTIIITDPHAEKFLDTPLNKTHIKNLTIGEVFNLILNENNLSYTLENNILKISYLTSKVFAIDYILSVRKSKGSTDITLSSSGGTQGGAGASTTGAGGTSDAQSESGIMIESNDEVKFWEALDAEFQSILNRPHDIYEAELPIINKNAGLVTVTSTIKQMQRFESYLKRLQAKVQLQVLIDVQLLLVTMNEGSSTGVDWSQLYKLQNMTLSAEALYSQNLGTAVTTPITTIAAPVNGVNQAVTASLFKASGTATLNEVIKFLQTQGDVNALSNPKVLTLNNQPALITVGTEYFYKLTSTETLAGGAGAGSQSENQEVKSVFSGILLDITPEISDDRTITLKINPSVSEINGEIPIDPVSGEATMPPNLDRRQLSSVVTVKDGKRIILGGLINVKNSINANQVPLLGDIPVLGYFFKYEEKSKVTQELVIIIEPHIIDKEHSTLSLKDLGYKGMTDELLNITKPMTEKLIDAELK